MPSTFDSLLRLELQASGENQNTWGTKTNTNLELLAQAIAGHVSVDATGSGDLTLSTSNAATDEARRQFITLSGTLVGNRSIIVPSASKTYVFRDNSSGAGTITVKTAAGTGVTIVRSGISHIVCDGTETYLVEDATKLETAGGTISGALGVVGNVSVGGAVSVSAGVGIGGALVVGGAGTFAGIVSVGGAIVGASNLTIAGITSVNTLDANGAATFASTLGVAASVSIGGALRAGAGLTANESGALSTPVAFGLNDPTDISGISDFVAYRYDTAATLRIPHSSNIIRFNSLSDGAGPYLEYVDTNSTAFGTRAFISDVKFKENVRDAAGKHLDYILSMKIRQFNWKPESPFIGHVKQAFIAQELQAIDDQFVSDIGGTLHINVDAILARAIGAIQELEARVKMLEDARPDSN